MPKPHPDMLLKLMKFTGVASDRVLMIGDTTHDLELARNAGVAAIGVAYGAHPAEALNRHHPEWVAHDVAELSNWLHQYA